MVPAAFTVGVITTLLAALTGNNNLNHLLLNHCKPCVINNFVLLCLAVVSMKGLGVGVILLVIAVGQILARSIPQPAPIVAAPAPAPIPIYYGRQTAPVPVPEPVWIEKDWH